MKYIYTLGGITLNVLKVNDLVKIYESRGKLKTKALNKINLAVNEGEFTAIMGPSGSGKTTLLNILSGIDTVSSGTVEISAQDICTMKKSNLALFRLNHLGIVFQEFNLLDSLTVKENIMLPMILQNKEPEEIDNKLKNITKLLEIEDIEEKYPYEISGGQQQRAAIARAVINDPDIIFADEPTGNLDSKASENVMQYFEKLNKVNNNTILIVTHDPFAASFCNRLIFIKDGEVSMEICKKGSREEFYDEILQSLGHHRREV